MSRLIIAIPSILDIIVMIISMIRDHRWVSGHFIREPDTSSWIPLPIMISFVLTPTLKAPFVFASWNYAWHVITAANFFDWAAALWAILVVLVKLPRRNHWFNMVTGMPTVSFHLAFETDHRNTFATLDLGDSRVWCADPFLAFWFRT